MQLYVDKGTDQMRSTFTGIGLAQLLYDIPSAGSGQKVWIKDLGSCYVIESKLSQDDLRAEIERKGFLPPLLPAFTKPLTEKEKKQLDTGTSLKELMTKYVPQGFIGRQIDYEAAKEMMNVAKKQKTKDRREEGEEFHAHPDFPVWSYLNGGFNLGAAMRKNYPTVLHTWHAHVTHSTQLWDVILSCYSQFPNQIESAKRHWEEKIYSQLAYKDFKIETEVSQMTIIVPSANKGVSAPSGYNQLKEDKNALPHFWLEIYLAYVGFLMTAMPFRVGNDAITYYPLPKHIELTALKDIISNYRNSSRLKSLYSYSNSMSRAKLDVLNQLEYYSEMIKLYAEAKDFNLDAIDGLIGYYYKHISTQIPFDETLFRLPAWISPNLAVETLFYTQDLIDNHSNLIKAIYRKDKTGKTKLMADESTLIDLYRRYCTHGEAIDWIKFSIAYGMYYFRKRPELKHLKPLTLEIFKESFPMSNLTNDKVDYRPILENESFERIAKAINYCTSYARYMREKDRTFPFRAWHGLGDDLLRNAHNPELFLVSLSEFILRYRSESIKVQADTRKTRAEIHHEDVAAIVGLVADYGSNIVAHLLVASGYADRRPKND